MDLLGGEPAPDVPAAQGRRERALLLVDWQTALLAPGGLTDHAGGVHEHPPAVGLVAAPRLIMIAQEDRALDGAEARRKPTDQLLDLALPIGAATRSRQAEDRFVDIAGAIERNGCVGQRRD